jgi:hypothetical protein
MTGGKPISVLLQFTSGVSAINPLVAFYDMHGGKRDLLLLPLFFFIIAFYDVHTTEYVIIICNVI